MKCNRCKTTIIVGGNYNNGSTGSLCHSCNLIVRADTSSCKEIPQGYLPHPEDLVTRSSCVLIPQGSDFYISLTTVLHQLGIPLACPPFKNQERWLRDSLLRTAGGIYKRSPDKAYQSRVSELQKRAVHEEVYFRNRKDYPEGNQHVCSGFCGITNYPAPLESHPYQFDGGNIICARNLRGELFFLV